MDVDGDGNTDLVHIESTGEHIVISSLLSNGDGKWSPKTSTVLISDLSPGNSFTGQETRQWTSLDVNGDGRADLVHLSYSAVNGLVVRSLLSAGRRWVADARDAWPNFDAGDTHNWQVLDVNGDGADDLVHIARLPNYTLRTDSLLSLGRGPSAVAALDHPTNWQGVSHNVQPPSSGVGTWVGADTPTWYGFDVNGDGRSDLVHVSAQNGAIRIDTLLSQGTGVFLASEPNPVATPVDPSASSTVRPLVFSEGVTWKVADADGDGLADLVQAWYRFR